MNYSPLVLACVAQGVVELPKPAQEFTLTRKERTPLVKGDGRHHEHHPEIAAAVEELKSLTEIRSGTIARVAYKHRANYQTVRRLFARWRDQQTADSPFDRRMTA